jgi:hypothetical protein
MRILLGNREKILRGDRRIIKKLTELYHSLESREIKAPSSDALGVYVFVFVFVLLLLRAVCTSVDSYYLFHTLFSQRQLCITSPTDKFGSYFCESEIELLF